MSNCTLLTQRGYQFRELQSSELLEEIREAFPLEEEFLLVLATFES
jgi:hypothetical protein